MKNKMICGIIYTLSIVAGGILFFAERRWRNKKAKKTIIENNN